MNCKKYSYFFPILILFLVSCTKSNDAGKDIHLPSAVILDTAYGADPYQKMDIYLAADRDGHAPTIVLIHGGGWSGGDKNELTSSVKGIQDIFPGYAVVNINYRLAKDGVTNVFPTQENDVKSAIETILRNTGKFHVSDKLILIGFSAGGHLALLHGYKNDPGRNVKAIVDFFGPTDLAALSDIGLVQALILLNATGKLIGQDKEIFIQSSPINFITKNAPPTIILQGGKDDLVPQSQAIALNKKLEENNVVHQLVVYPNEGHGWTGNNLLDSFNKIKDFINANVN
ncbi:MAG: alpha/beta hydrolase [Bacteroidetes bacterium]|nr:alpha/beta hydrolase [Bacteroidota bacterium]